MFPIGCSINVLLLHMKYGQVRG